MKFARFATSTALALAATARSASAFRPATSSAGGTFGILAARTNSSRKQHPQHPHRRQHHLSTSSSSSSSKTALRANVIKLSDPEKQLLDGVDVFIFDCDGVIWRVRACYVRLAFVLIVILSWFADVIEGYLTNLCLLACLLPSLPARLLAYCLINDKHKHTIVIISGRLTH